MTHPFTPEMIYIDREVEAHPRTEAILGRLPNVPTELVTDVRGLKHITDVGRAKKEWIITRHRGRSFKPCQGMPKGSAGSSQRVDFTGSTPLTSDFPQHCLDCWGKDDDHLDPGSGQGSSHRVDLSGSTPEDPGSGHEEQRDGLTPAHICCCYYIIDLISGCPMDCSYCILQSYLENNPRTQIFINVEEMLAEVMLHMERYPDTTFRIGTGELGDSLALDPITGFSETLIPFFAEEKNAILELKTKTDFVDHLLDLRHNNHTVISWSVNSDRIINEEEHAAASLTKRLAAAMKCVDVGYKVGFHFDPIIMTTADGIKDYEDTIDRIFDAVDPKHIAWISLGLLRLPYSMKASAQRRFPKTRIFSGEIVPAGNKLRYPRFLRTQYYKPLWDRLTKHLPAKKVYLCMETKAVWGKFDSSITCHEDLERRLTT